MANLITLIRLLLLIVVVILALDKQAVWWQILNAPLILIIIALDGLDGYVARKRHETSQFGAIFDIAADRVVEAVLWIVLAQVGLVPIWVTLVFIVRGILVDSLRNQQVRPGQAPFSMMQTPLGKFLVASRTMRFFYGFIKAVTFCWLLFWQPLRVLEGNFWQHWASDLIGVSNFLIYLAVTLCLIRGVPVLMEVAFMQTLRRSE